MAVSIFVSPLHWLCVLLILVGTAILQEYAPTDPWLDGILRFGGGYSNWLSNSTGARGEVFKYVKDFSSAVAELNTGSLNSNLSSCVYVPPPEQGLGCKCGLLPCRCCCDMMHRCKHIQRQACQCRREQHVHVGTCLANSGYVDCFRVCAASTGTWL